MLLREQRDEVHLAVVIEVDGNDVDRPGARIDRVIREDRPAWGPSSVFSMIAICPVFRHPNAATSEIVPAIAVEVGGLDVGDPRPAVEPEGAELAVAESAQPDDGALVVIGREELAEIGDEQILDAVLVDVGQGDVRRMRDAGDRRQRAVRPAGLPVNTRPWRMSVPSRLELLVAAEMHQLDVRYRGRPGHVRQRQCAPRELNWRLAGIAATAPARADARARRLVKNGSACSMSGGSCTVRLTTPAGRAAAAGSRG